MHKWCLSKQSLNVVLSVLTAFLIYLPFPVANMCQFTSIKHIQSVENEPGMFSFLNDICYPFKLNVEREQIITYLNLVHEKFC